MNNRTLREFHELCLTTVRPLKPKEIREIRLREGASQAVRYLNVTTGLISQGERGKSARKALLASCSLPWPRTDFRLLRDSRPTRPRYTETSGPRKDPAPQSRRSHRAFPDDPRRRPRGRCPLRRQGFVDPSGGPCPPTEARSHRFHRLLLHRRAGQVPPP